MGLKAPKGLLGGYSLSSIDDIMHMELKAPKDFVGGPSFSSICPILRVEIRNSLDFLEVLYSSGHFFLEVLG